MTSVLALDVGTSMVKAVLLDADGVVLGRESHATPEDGAPGADPDALWQTVAGVLRTLAAATSEPVGAVVVSGQGDGLWSIDVDGRAQRAYPWNSVVASDIVQAWERDGVIDRRFAAAGTVLWPGTNAAVWRWLEDTDPARIDRTAAVFAAKDLIGYLLTGEVATDVTDGTISFLDPTTHRYDPAAIEELGCAAITERLAPVRAPGELLGTVHADAAALTGIPAGTPLYLGVLDLIAMIRAAGLRAPGDALAVLGTTAVAVSIIDALPSADEPSGATVALPERHRYLRVLGASSGTTTLEWFLRTHGYTGDDRHARFWDDVNAAGDEGVLLLPYLAGERAPFLAPQATGALLGLTSTTTLGGMARSVVEGITFSLRHCLEAAGAGEDDLVLTGGGSTRPEWCQLVADVIGRPVVVEARPDLGALGAASFVPGFAGLAERDDPGRRTRVTPSDRHAALDARYRRFLGLVEEFRTLWQEYPRL